VLWARRIRERRHVTAPSSVFDGDLGAYGLQFLKFREPIARAFAADALLGLLKKALPDCAEGDIFWGYHFVTGALTLTLARTGRIDRLSGGLCKSDDYAAVKERMASFMAAGFLDLCKRSSRT